MAQREGSVYLWLFIVAMFLFVLTTVAFVMQFNKTEKIEGEKVAAVKKSKESQAQVKAMRVQRNELRTLIVGVDGVTMYDNTESLIAKMRSDELPSLRKVINAAHKDLGKAEIKKFKSLIDPYHKVSDLFSTYRTTRDEAVKDRNTAATKYTADIDSRSQNLTLLQQRIKDLLTQVSDAQQAKEDCDAEKDATVARLTKEMEENEENFTDALLDKNRMLQRKESELATLQILVKQLQKKETRARNLGTEPPDGSLIDVSSRLGKAWIDLGRKNHLRSGLIFRVYQEIKGGKKLYKGRVEVRRVNETHAEVAVIEEVDPDHHPMTPGDRVTSPFYDEKDKPVFVFAGVKLATEEMTQDFVRAKLTGYGVEIRSNVDIHTSFLVALKDYEKTTEFKVAERLGIPILREQELMEFIGY
jgi:hypothetical protein